MIHVGYRPSHGSLGTKQSLELFLAYHIDGLFISYSFACTRILLFFLSLHTCYLAIFSSLYINWLSIVILAGNVQVCSLLPVAKHSMYENLSHLKIISDTLLFNIWFMIGVGSSRQVRVLKFILWSVCGLLTKPLHL